MTCFDLGTFVLDTRYSLFFSNNNQSKVTLNSPLQRNCILLQFGVIKMYKHYCMSVWLPRFGIVWSTRPGAAMNSRSSHVVTSPTFLEFPQNHSATKLYISSQIFWQITRYLVLLNNDYTSRNIGFGRRQNQTQWPPWLP